MATIRENYESIAKKLDETAHYPGNWLYESWTESDLKEFLDERGVPVPQPTTRDKLIASVRRNARLASLNMKETSASASASAQAVKESLSDALFDSWSDSDIKAWADKNGIKVPQGSKRNELLALARKHRSSLYGDNVASSASSAFGAATSKAGNQFAAATEDASMKAEDLFNSAIGTWSESRLKAFLDARGIPVPQAGNKDELLATVRLNKNKATSGWSASTFDTWSTENLKWVYSMFIVITSINITLGNGWPHRIIRPPTRLEPRAKSCSAKPKPPMPARRRPAVPATHLSHLISPPLPTLPKTLHSTPGPTRTSNHTWTPTAFPSLRMGRRMNSRLWPVVMQTTSVMVLAPRKERCLPDYGQALNGCWIS